VIIPGVMTSQLKVLDTGVNKNHGNTMSPVQVMAAT